MAIQYTPNAAAISWLALSQALESRAIMEGSLFSMFSDNTKMAIDQAKSQADSAQKAMEDQAQQTLNQGISGMVGAASSIGTTLVCMGMEKLNGNRANNCNLTETTEFEMKDLSSPSSKSIESLESENIPKGSTKITGQTNFNTYELSEEPVSPRAQIKGSNRGTATLQDSVDKTTQSQDNQAEDNSAKQKKYLRNMDFWANNSNTFSSMVNQISQSSGNLASIHSIKDQGKEQAAQALAQGLSTVFNNQGSMLSAALSSCDSYMQNTNGTISALIQTSAARG